MFVYADPECYFFLPVNFQAAPVNRNDSELMCNCFIEVRNTTLSRRNRIYRVSQEECEILRESVPYVKLYRYNPKHLYPKLNGYGDNGQRMVWTSCISA